MHLADQLYAAGIGVFPCYTDKSPAVKRGVDWRVYAAQPPDTWAWPSHLVGVPVPPGVLIIDLDTYKGVTRRGVDDLLGAPLDWDAALVQYTMHGGQHYAFRAPDWQPKQGDSLEGLKGFDTRVAGKGYIATGAPDYAPFGFGLFAFTQPAALPAIPDTARAVLEHVANTLPATTLPTNRQDDKTLMDALCFVDPSCGRSAWVKIGMALRHHFHADEAWGLWLFDAWSSGEYWHGGCPDNYVADDVPGQWASFKPEGSALTATIGSVYYAAIQGGWRPPAAMDTAAAFGAGSAPADRFNDLVDEVQAQGGNPKYTQVLIEWITALDGNALQVATLLALLTRELKDAGLLSKPVRQQLDGLASTSAAPTPAGFYGKNHTDNAHTFLTAHYPHNKLVRSDQVWYVYTDKAWLECDDDDIRHELTVAMAPSGPQSPNISGTYSLLASLCHQPGSRINDVPPELVLFDNGVLDLTTGQLQAHTPAHFTTNILPYVYNPAALCPRWLVFLYEVFEGDQQRADLLQEWFGYMLSNSYDHHKIMLLLGPPRCGKGTIGRVLARVVGKQNFTGASLHAFADDAFIESLRVKSVAFSGDTERRVSRGVVDVVIERVKKISGYDEVTFRRKYKSTLSQTLPARITLAANHVPGLFDDSGALASRLLVLPFDVSYLDRENLNLFNELATEIEGVARWALDGLARLSAAGAFTRPDASLMETDFIAEAYSPLKVFIDELCTLGGANFTPSDSLHDAYHAWAVTNREERILPRKIFISAFKDATRGQRCTYGVHRIGGASLRGFKGLQVAAAAPAGAFTPKEVTA